MSALQAHRARLDDARARYRAAVQDWARADEDGDRKAAHAADTRMRYWERQAAEAAEAVYPVVHLDLDALPMLEGWARSGDAARFADTPVWQPRRGQCVHVGGGVFVTVCAECDHAVKHRGTVPRYATTGPHEVAEHAALVGGINVGLLA